MVRFSRANNRSSGTQVSRMASAEESVLRVSSVSKTFETGAGELVHALRNVSVEISPGKILSLVGPSGCGKSTLLMIVAGLVRATSGTVAMGNTVITAPTQELGVAFQRDYLFEWRSVLDNILAQVDLRGWKRTDFLDRAHELLAIVGLEDQASRYPRELSGGMRQRVALCRALLHGPSLLLLDEPFGALDALTRERLNVDVSAICAAAKTSVLFVTHDIGEAVFMGDHVAVMAGNPGRIAETFEVTLPNPRTLDIRNSMVYSNLLAEVRSALVNVGAYAA